MRGSRAASTVLLVLGSLLAGCVDEGPTSTASVSPTQAPEATTTADTGAVKGTVVTDEMAPIPHAVVGMLETKAQTTTDAAGAFAMNDLLPGKYSIVVQALGFREDAKKIDVLAGEVTEVRMVLEPIEISPDAYSYTIPNKAFIKLGQWTVQYTQHQLNESNLNSQLCDPCAFNLYLVPNIKGALSEADYTPSLGLPHVNHEIGMGVIKDYVQGQTSSYMILTYLKPRASYNWTESTVKSLRGDNLVRLQVHGPGPNDPGIAFQQSVNMYSSFGVNDLLPEGFSAMPPK
ncbi:MAG: carboxypeptidase regulatory-like domain-containing protein [Euryarchaeota archaeon]|nr:carboxypeptidase regulatory-like domain-containing protein [Euryarchaeota archaeon]